MSMFEGNFCCKKMEEWQMSGEWLPIIKTDELCYNFASRQIDYCPFCGSLIIAKIPSGSESLDKSICCGLMEYFCNMEDIIEDFVPFGIFYDAFSRRYYFSKHQQFWWAEEYDYEQWDMFYCIFCGTKLPESLLEMWLDIVTKEFGALRLERSEKMLPFVPEEYRTDAWWKKRGL